MTTLWHERQGFRLQRLEIYNWGTFDGQIWTMTTEGETAVLTGANGSGKSTVVDALLTLLVEGRHRNYNLASGADSKRERNERTYVRGQYSRSRGEGEFEAKANTLRGKDAHSVLLGVFYDAAQDRTVTLAQVLWISNVDRVEKRYFVAPFELSIEKHFATRHVTGRNLPNGVEGFGSTFKDYILGARKALGLSGRPKALDLFNETVAVKDIPSLNEFVRNHMLDKGDPERQVEGLRNQYRELNEAHAAIQKAGKQLDILLPLMQAGQDYRRFQEQIIRHEAAKTLVPFYVAGKARELLAQAIQQLTSDYDAQASRLGNVDAEIDNRRAEIERVKIAIAQDNVGQMKREIEQNLTGLRPLIDSRKGIAQRYDDDAQRLGLARYQHEEDFYSNRNQAQTMLTMTQAQIEELEEERADLQFTQRDNVQRGQTLHDEIQYLRDNLSNIPAQVANIRQMISEALHIAPEEMPFVGELLQVRPEESVWEGALERLLHSFAQDIIVPENHYRRVSQYVNERHLGGRLVYRRVNTSQVNGRLLQHQTSGTMAYDKLQIKADTPYHDWLATNLMQRFAYTCCDTLADFQQAERAITQSGQIKHSASRHEKDDRRQLQDRRYYVLGWDNRDKLHQLETELDDLQREVMRLNERLATITQELERRRQDINALNNLLKVATFESIDWRTPQAEVDRLKQALANLDDSQIKQLERERDDLQHQIKQAEARRDDIRAKMTTFDNQRRSYQLKLTEAETMLNAATTEDEARWREVGGVIAEVDREELTIENFATRINTLETQINRSIAGFRGTQGIQQATILDAMNTFRREYPDEGASLTAEIASLLAFEAIYGRLHDDDLPRHEERFKQMLDRTVTRGVIAFNASLQEQERAIERSIGELNDSLARVDYGNGSTIRLVAESAKNSEIADFQRDLKACAPDAGDNSPEELQRAYGRIKALIERFDNDPNWMKRVIDVRRWRNFSAEQIDTQGRQIDYYTDSSGKSGGQKAKLAYTILASAIAHQYGLQDAIGSERTFRLVVIDEAFSKLDDDNARFAMRLFEQLGLQLLVVTPMQQLHIIEDFVKAYHVVVNNEEGSYSRLFNLTQAQYHERRREFQS